MIVLCVGGLDPSSGAGILADTRTVTELGACAMAVVTAWTAQSSQGVSGWGVLPPAAVHDQLSALRADFPIAAAKVGMLGDAAMARTVVEALSGLPIVLDPVLAPTLGGTLSRPDLVDEMRNLAKHVWLITPNFDEADALVGTRDPEAAARRLCELGCRAALVKGGETAVDVLCADGQVEVVAGRVVSAGFVHGTGCMLASAIATYGGAGVPLPMAVRLAKGYVARKIAAARPLGTGALRYAV